MNRFQRMALLTTATTYLLIAVGGLVRAAGAGLGCPDWPRCFGLWIPPLDVGTLPVGFDADDFNVFKTWTEYLNRLLGALTGLLILVTLVLAVRDHRGTPRVLWSTTGAFALVVVNAWLGGQVVRTGLAPWVLTAHLVMALAVVSLLLYAAVSAFFPDGPSAAVLDPGRRRLSRLAWAGVGIVLIQVGTGAFLRGEVQGVAEAGVLRSAWLAHVGFSEILHRSLALLTVSAVLVLAVFARRLGDSGLRRVADAAVVLAGIQVLAGLGLTSLGFPRVLQVVHLWGAALVLGTISLLGLLAGRLDPRPLRDRRAAET